MQRTNTIIIRYIRGLLFLLMLWPAIKAHSQEQEYEFNIHEQSLELILIRLASQVGLALYMPSELTQGVPAKPLVGKWSVNQALLFLLEGTDIQFELSQRKVLVLTPQETKNNLHIDDQVAEKPYDMVEILVISERKRRSRILEQSSYTVIDPTELSKLNALNLLDFNHAVPGLQVKRIGEHNTPNIYLRGISAFDHTEAGEQSIAYYTDGVLSPRAQGATTLLFDIDNIEVQRGPQAARRGKAAIGGVINIQSNIPDKEFYSSLDVSADSRERLGTSLAINIPITNQLALRFAGASKKQAGDIGFIDQQMGNSRNYGEVDMNAFRISGRFTPSAQQSLLVSYEQFDDYGTGRIPTQEPENFLGSALAPGSLNLSQEAIRVRWESNNKFANILYIAGISSFDQTQIWAPKQTQTINRKPWSSNNTFQHELSLTKSVQLPSGKDLSFTLGAFDYSEKNAIRFDLQHLDRQTIEQAPPHVQTSYIQPNRGGHTRSLYGELNLPLEADWFVDVALRYSHNKRYDKSGRNIFCSSHINGPLPEAAAQLSEVTDQLCWVASYNEVHGEWNKVIGSINIAKHFSTNHSWYLSLAKGWKPGSVSDGVDSSVTQGKLDQKANQKNLLQPETNWVLETGFKNTYFNNNLLVQASVFAMDHKDIQELVFTGESGREPFKRSNGASSTSLGTELKSDLTLKNRWQASAAISLISARYQQFLTHDEIFLERGVYWNPCLKQSANSQCSDENVLDLKGNRVPFTPTISLNTHISKAFHSANGGDITPSINLSFQSDMYFSQENRRNRPAGFIDSEDPGEAEFDMQKAYALIDLDVEYLAKNKYWGFRLFVKNVTNEMIKEGIEINTNFYQSAYYWAPTRVFGLHYFSSI